MHLTDVKKLGLIIAAAATLAASVAGHARAGDATLLGTGLGAAFGGLFGSQFGHGSSQVFSTAVGIGAGGLIGNSIGQSIENDDNASRYAGSSYNSYQPSSPIIYQSYAPNYVAPPAPAPTATYIDDSAGTYCRPYSQHIRVNGRLAESYGTACLQPDGSWRVVP